MDRIEAMRAFVRIVERRSFAKAAHDLATSRSRLSEVVQRLERQAGVRLLNRTTRHVSPTPEGEEYVRRWLAILTEIDAAEAAIAATAPAGPLRVDVHGTMARHFLLPDLPEFLRLYPGIQLHLGEGDRLVDLVAEGIDCVIRVGKPADSSLVGRQLGAIEEGTFASPAYLERHGVPTSPTSLAGHHVVGFVSSLTRAVLPLEFRMPDGTITVPLPASVTVSAAPSYVCLAVQGMGLIQVPRYRVAHELATGALVEVLADTPPEPSPVYVLYPAGRHPSSRTRAFVDWASALLVPKFRRD
ncbi:LysR family transcriptional regulator [Methylobacterium sp. J-078]|uniref:LysR substrate-binding domain-containing protein n=1 Tax=Methylobacterium sp. J-078 TaxID=2836657 RepID=UPI001FB95919|nr:LysR family transcriptional regulator [Methylobacterium sp. J-078]MCJ2043525.1 LysR family transcriptional regulator [Methylobacterium sp. J-078]